MRIIISPAKNMHVDADGLAVRGLPAFLPQTETLCRTMQGMPAEALQKLWMCNDRIAALNVERLRHMDLYTQLTPALLSYEGIQYRYMAPNVFTGREYDYIQERLRILSGFYGVLRPFDGVRPYRLEMQAKLAVGGAKDLYAFWGGSLAAHIFSETDCVLNLASKEYSVCISRYLRSGIRFVSCVFGEEKEGRIVEKGTMCKMARGEMLRFMAERRIETPEDIRAFDRLDYAFDPARSDADTYVFVKKGEAARARPVS